jgi:Flp pilus assembly secretin CpaC
LPIILGENVKSSLYPFRQLDLHLLAPIDGQKASLHVGQRVARIVSSTRIAGGGGRGGLGGGPDGGADRGVVNSITMDNVGLLVAVTPHIRRDGLVVLTIDIERSQLGPAEEGPVISKLSDGEAIRAAPVENLTTETTVSARSGQTVIVGAQQARRQARQSELLIVVTPELPGNEPPGAAR